MPLSSLEFGKRGIVVNSVLHRRRWIVRRRLEGWKVTDIVEALCVSEKTVAPMGNMGGRVWRKPYATHIVHKTPQLNVDLVLKLKREKH